LLGRGGLPPMPAYVDAVAPDKLQITSILPPALFSLTISPSFPSFFPSAFPSPSPSRFPSLLSRFVSHQDFT
jgi:hypothetical protein